MEVLVRPAAASDINEAYVWYARRRPELGDEFLAATQSALERIRTFPARGSIVHRDTRRIFLERYPYQLLYRIQDDVAIVVACMHLRRDPSRWQSRT